jgi:hypothetical protein
LLVDPDVVEQVCIEMAQLGPRSPPHQPKRDQSARRDP